MAYHTRYQLKVYPESHRQKIASEFHALFVGDPTFWHSCTWLECQKEALAVSEANPSILFSIYGDGEDSGDMWRQDYLNGSIVGKWKMPAIDRPDADAALIESVLKSEMPLNVEDLSDVQLTVVRDSIKEEIKKRAQNQLE